LAGEAAEQGQVAILSSGVWQIRHAVSEITGMTPVRWLPPLQRPKFGCVVGWGLKPTTAKARELSKKTDSAFIALEDGFLRSVHPGADYAPISLVMDRTGIHYDATSASDAEVLIADSAQNFDPTRLARARAGIDVLRARAISKYNHAPRASASNLGLDPTRRSGRVLVVDQTVGDCSISYGHATADTFRDMLSAAIAENPDSEIVVKVHPEVVSGKKLGHLLDARGSNVRVIGIDINPWSLIEEVDRVYVVSSQLGLEALLAGKSVVCFGAPFYAGWGLTEDRVEVSRRAARPNIEQLFAALYFDYCRYVLPETSKQISFEEAVDWLVRSRGHVMGFDAEGWPSH